MHVQPLALLFVALSVYAGHQHQGSQIDRRSLSHSHAAPLIAINETDISMHHKPTPPSYYTVDWEEEGHARRYPGLIIAHGIFMTLAFFVALPIGIILRSVNHTSQGLATLAFYCCCALGCFLGGLYRKLTLNMYEGAAHSKQGYIIILVAMSLSAPDIWFTIRRAIYFFKGPEKSFKSFWRKVVKKEVHPDGGPEYSGILFGELGEFENMELNHESVELQEVGPDDVEFGQPERWPKLNAMADPHHHRRNDSLAPELIDSPRHSQDTFPSATRQRIPAHGSGRLHQIAKGTYFVVERALVIAGFAQLLMGIVTYTGGCRSDYQNGCLAHLIKGGIFWCYGLLTFARFLGAFADRGWAWNASPSEDFYTAELTESAVIFLYGITNTWMERFNAKPGDPFTTKQIQHISIAVMFCFAGLAGMGIESKGIRKWLASSVFTSSTRTEGVPSQESVVEPLSYMGSSNPFPALVIGMTGAAMAAHKQTYLFQVQIHALWGYLLVTFSVLRCLTYLCLWLRPPRSTLPSRPPTEALGSFSLACGGLVFMFSTEEVTFAALRRGRDDIMMFLNVAVALTCLVFCWTLSVLVFKGWMKSQTRVPVTYRNAA